MESSNQRPYSYNSPSKTSSLLKWLLQLQEIVYIVLLMSETVVHYDGVESCDGPFTDF